MSLKITNEHLETLRAAITPLDTRSRREQYIRGEFPRAALTKNLAMRYRWDLLWAAVDTPAFPTSKWVCDNLYPYLNDEHIDSALREILRMDHRSTLSAEGARNVELTGDML